MKGVCSMIGTLDMAVFGIYFLVVIAIGLVTFCRVCCNRGLNDYCKLRRLLI